MSATALEAFLARLYTDEPLRRAFLEQPAPVARAAGLDEATVQQLTLVDREGLAMAADSFARKRAAHARHGARAGWMSRWRGWSGWRR
jgi:hypothetical protein